MIYRDSKGRFCKAPSIKGYKGFEQGLICLEKQYKVGEVFTEPEAIPCERGMHFCKNPLDVLKFYHPVSNIGIPNEYAEVEALEEPVTDDNIKFCTTKLKVVRKLSLDEFIQAGINYALEHNQNVKKSNTGYCSITTNTGYCSITTNTGNCSAATNTGYCSAATNTGNCSVVTTNGDYSAVTNTGDYSIAFSNGNCSIVASTGYYSAVGVSGKHSVAVNTGCKGKVKGTLGCWIACAEHNNKGYIVNFKSVYVDGKDIKADTWYRLENGKFVEVN